MFDTISNKNICPDCLYLKPFDKYPSQLMFPIRWENELEMLLMNFKYQITGIVDASRIVDLTTKHPVSPSASFDRWMPNDCRKQTLNQYSASHH